jgi:hypothetical protein
MPKLQINKHTVDVRFNHFNVTDNFGYETRGTECKLWFKNVLLGEGVAVCHPNDNFEKRIGRKVAFGKAVSDTGFNKEGRTALWDAFFDLEGTP